MSLLSYVLLAATAACCFTTLSALPMEGFGSRNCQCVTTTSSVIRSFQRIEIVPPGANCRKTEILVTRKNNQIVCIDPEAQWINNAVSKVMRSKRTAKETAVATAA